MLGHRRVREAVQPGTQAEGLKGGARSGWRTWECRGEGPAFSSLHLPHHRAAASRVTTHSGTWRTGTSPGRLSCGTWRRSLCSLCWSDWRISSAGLSCEGECSDHPARWSQSSRCRVSGPAPARSQHSSPSASPYWAGAGGEGDGGGGGGGAEGILQCPGCCWSSLTPQSREDVSGPGVLLFSALASQPGRS